MQNSTAADMIRTLAGDAERKLTDETDEAIHLLRNLIRTAGREIAVLESGRLVSTDWIEQDASRYHDHLTAIGSLNRELSALRYAERKITEEVTA